MNNQQDNQRHFCVYIHKNKENGKEYIGMTGERNPNERWRNGTRYTANDYFNKAINKHGWDGFDHIIVATNLTQEEALQLEMRLIKEHNTTNRDKGYNISEGGQAGHYIDGRCCNNPHYYRDWDRAHPEKRKKAVERMREKRKKDPECRKAHNEAEKRHYRKMIANETPEERAARVAKDNERQRKARMNETPEEKEARRKRRREWERLYRQKKKEEQQREHNQDGCPMLRNDKEAGN